MILKILTDNNLFRNLSSCRHIFKVGILFVEASIQPTVVLLIISCIRLQNQIIKMVKQLSRQCIRFTIHNQHFSRTRLRADSLRHRFHKLRDYLTVILPKFLIGRKRMLYIRFSIEIEPIIIILFDRITQGVRIFLHCNQPILQ